MSGKARFHQLPLLPGDAPAAAVFGNDHLLDFGAVVAQDGLGFRLVDISEIATKAVREGNPSLSFRLSDVAGTPMAQVPARLATAVGFDFGDPRLDQFDALCQQLQTPLLVHPSPVGPVGPMVFGFFDPAFNFQLGRRVYRCSVGHEPYDEKDYVRLGGACPNHRPNGQLR